MDANRFDTMTRRFATRRTLIAGGLGLAATSALGATSLAQEATPEDPGDASGFGQTFFFVQTFTGGTFTANPDAGMPMAEGTPTAGVHGDYLLELGGHPGQTVYFSDESERIMGDAPTDSFIEGLGFGAENPPNAALVTENADGQTVVAVLELINPQADLDGGTVTYEATLLDDYVGDGLGHLVERNEASAIPESFESASLYIDDCPKQGVVCMTGGNCNTGTEVGTGSMGGCWSWSHFSCELCNNPSDWCNDNVSACNGSCTGEASSDCDLPSL